MLLNEFLKEHKNVEQQQVIIERLTADATNNKATISELNKIVQAVLARLDEQDIKIQKMSAQLELSKRPTRVAVIKP